MHPSTIEINKRFAGLKHTNFASTEIGNIPVLYQLSEKEKRIVSFETNICTYERANPYYFFTFPAEIRKNLDIKQGDILLFKIRDKGKSAIDIQKVLKWGKMQISIPLARDFFVFEKDSKITIEILKKSAPTSSLQNENSFDATQFFSKSAHFIERPDGFVTIWQPRRRPLTIPRLIQVDGELFENLYLIWGDGCTTHGKTYFANKCTNLHCKIISFFDKYLAIPKDFWRLRIMFKNYSKENNHIVDYWLTSLDFEKSQLYPTISDSVFLTPENGNARIVLESTMLTELIDNLLQYINSNLDKFSVKEQLHMLNGILMAEGSAEQTENCYGLHYISISFSQEERQLFENILQNLGLSKNFSCPENRMFKFVGWKNQYALLKLFALNGVKIMNSHPKRLGKILSFLEHSYVKSMNAYLSALGENELTVNDFVDKLHYDKSSIYNYASKYSPFINTSKEPNALFQFKISEEGKSFIKTINYLNAMKEVVN